MTYTVLDLAVDCAQGIGLVLVALVTLFVLAYGFARFSAAGLPERRDD